MEGFVNDFARLVWQNIKVANRENVLSLLMLYAAVQHPEQMHNMLPNYGKLIGAEEGFEKDF